MPSMIFYERAVALNRERHQKLKILIKPDHFRFAAKTNSVLLAAAEVAEASRDFPVVFVGKEGGPFTLAAMVGLLDHENVMVNGAGEWEVGAYVPAFIRRYPFVLAGPDDAESLTVCIDEAYPGLGETEGQALFGDDGLETDYLKRLVEFLSRFHAEMRRTTEFAAKLAELGLLTSRVITIERQGTKQTLEGFWVIDETKLNALEDARLLELFRGGFMGMVYAHLLSLSNIPRLARRLDSLLNAALPQPKSDAGDIRQ